MEFGLATFADVNPEKGSLKENTHRRFADLIDEIKFADELGLHVFGVGEHHRADYSVSSPSTVLAAAATVTKNIRLSTAVTVLSSEDIVRTYEQFATIDQLSSGRAEIMAGRGSFIESFPLFGYRLEDYDDLFAEKLDMLLAINNNEVVNWKGAHTQSLHNVTVYPRPYQDKIPVWQAVGGTPASAIRAASLGLPLSLAIIGGSPSHFLPFINLYKKNWISQQGLKPFRLSINSHMFIGVDSTQAAKDYYPYYAEVMNRIGKERGWTSLNEAHFKAMTQESGSLMVGSPAQVAEKIIYEYELFGNTRFLGQMSMGRLPHPMVRKSMELFATKVMPQVTKAIGIIEPAPLAPLK